MTGLPESHDRPEEGLAVGHRTVCDDLDTRLKLGNEALSSGDWAGARACFYAALALDRGDARAWLGLGDAYLRDDPPRLGLGAEAFAESLERDPGLVAAYRGLAVIAELRGAWGEAFALWNRVLTLCDTETEAYLGLVRYHEQMGDGPSVLAVLATWVLSDGADLAVLERLVTLAPAHDGVRFALEVLAQLLEREQLSAEWLHGVGRSFQLLGQLQCARVAYQRAVARQPEHLSAWRALGHIELELGQLEHALFAFKTVYELAPQCAESAFDLAVAHLESGECAEAISNFGKALLHAPHWIEARNGLGWAMLQDGRYSGARACFELALSVQPAHAPAWDGLGTTYWKLGQLDAAIEALQRASELTPFESGDGYRAKWGMLLALREGAKHST